MPENVRALIVVVTFAIPAFYLAGLLARPLELSREFVFWRNAWFVATISAFLLPSFYIFVVPVMMICLFARSVRLGGVDLYVVLLLAVPPAAVTLGGLGLQTILELNNARLLALVLLVPILMAPTGPERRQRGVFLIPDILIVTYVVLLTVLELRRSEASGILRAAVTYSLDVLLPYLAFSRSVNNIAAFRKVAFAFVVAVLPLALIGVVETSIGWPLYNAIVSQWGGSPLSGGRGGMLRAAASAMNSITFGYVVMVAIGCLLMARPLTSQPSRFSPIVMAILVAGLVASLSRGPWVGAMVLALVYLVTGPQAAVKLVKFGIASGVILVLMLMTTFGQKLVYYLPFVGSGDEGSVDYRQRLFEAAISVIERNLLLGSVDYNSTPEMKAMIQGQGIIDIVNSYLQIALVSGLLGLGLFAGFFMLVLFGLWKMSKLHKSGDVSIFARASMATLAAILVTIATVSSVEFIPYVYWSFAGLCVALVRVAMRERTAQLNAVQATRIRA